MRINFFLQTVVWLFAICHANAQVAFTPYDELPINNKSYKPAYSENYPDWAKMLYQYPVNYNDINSRFDAYMAQHKGEKSPIIRYFKIWRRIMEPYTLVDGTIQLPDMEKFAANLRNTQLESRFKLKSSNVSGINWSFLGPKETYWLNESGSEDAPGPCPWQVNVYSFDVSASNNNILYCGTETGYVNKTTNKGGAWTLAGQNYAFGGSVTAVAIHPTNPDIVYVAAGNQIHQTQDGGATWAPLLTTDQFNADRLKIDPANPLKLIAASAKGVYISADGGASWQKKWTEPAYDIEIKPDNNNVIYALTQTSTTKYSMVVSNDGGTTFQTIASFPSGIAFNSGGLLAVTPANSNILFVVMLSANSTPYLYKGTNNNGTFTWALTATGKTTAFGMDNGQGYFDLVLDVSPVNANTILVGTTTLFKSTNGGTSFTAIGGYTGDFAIHPDIQDIKMLPNGETWLATDGGMTITTDNFTSTNNYYSKINGLIGSDMWGFDQGWNEDLIVGGRYHNGNTAISDFYSSKALRMGGAESPTGWVLQGKSRHVAFNDLGNGWILPKTATGAPEGRFVFSKFPNMEEYGGRRSNLVHHPNYYGTLYLGQDSGFWRTTDLGTTFDLLYKFPDKVLYLQISYTNPLVIYADIWNKGLYKSTDGGITWTPKPSIASATYGGSYWKGRLFFVISPYNENIIYACLQNGTWSADIGKVYRSSDGGDTWQDWTGTVSGYTKCLVAQPTSAEKDLIYLFTTSKNGKKASVYYRSESMTDWAEFGDSYPSGMSVNLALPFFRDSKLRVAGNGGIWEAPFSETTFKPVINPWIEKQTYNCMLDTLYFDDHSILNHAGATWQWSFSPAPVYISNANVRNPKVVLGAPGKYSVTMSVTKDGQTYTKTLNDMVSATTCPSVDDCNNPAEIPKKNWKLVYADSEEKNYPGLASMAFDNDINTIWHTAWSTGSPAYPHEIQIDLGQAYQIYKFTYYPRQDGENGRIKGYELYFSNNKSSWGTAVKTGTLTNTSAPQTIILTTPASGRYFRLKAISEVNGNAWASAAELSLTGCNFITGVREQKEMSSLSAFPVPTNGAVYISVPSSEATKKLNYSVFSSSGVALEEGVLENTVAPAINLSKYPSGAYFIVIIDEQNKTYRMKVLKQ